MTNIFESLRQDHDRQRELIDSLVETSGDSADRKRIWAELKVELQAHAAAEERFLYVPMMKRDLTQDKARHSVAEHKELDDFIEHLDEYDMSGPQWVQTARELEHQLVHHLDEEEREVFQLAGKVLTQDQKTELALAYIDLMTEQRTA